jgi:hypothetical protein
LRLGNLEVIDFLKPRLLRCARKDSKKTFSAACYSLTGTPRSLKYSFACLIVYSLK